MNTGIFHYVPFLYGPPFQNIHHKWNRNLGICILHWCKSGFPCAKKMRMYIHWKICQFSLLNMTITERKTKVRENWNLLFLPMSGEYCKTILVLKGVPRNYKNPTFLEPLIATFIIQVLNYFFSYKWLQKFTFFAIFLCTM